MLIRLLAIIYLKAISSTHKHIQKFFFLFRNNKYYLINFRAYAPQAFMNAFYVYRSLDKA